MSKTWIVSWTVSVALGFACTLQVRADETTSLESVGARFGFNPDGAGKNFYLAEGFGNLLLPWSWELGSRFRMDSRADFSMGWLGQSRVEAFIASAGPSVLLRRGQSPLSVELGVSPTILSEWRFPTKNLGGWFQLTSHIGANYDFPGRVRVGYRFQHTSNGGIDDHNPGLNMHVLAISYLF